MTMLLVADELLTVQEVAQRLKVHPQTVLRWLRDGALHGVRLGGRRAGWRVKESDLEAYLEQQAKD